VILFRPTGLKKLLLVRDSGWWAWPPRLPENFGFVTRFIVPDDIVETYPVQGAGGRSHEEMWVPAEELEAFDRRIDGEIEVIAAFCDKRQISLDNAWTHWQGAE
jgi:hypothetical protein